MRAFIPFIALAAMLATISCTGESTMTMTKYGQAPAEDVARGLGLLASKKAFFGHQSGGMNIMDGLKDITTTGNLAPLAIAETRSAGDMKTPGLYHAHVGQNTDPLSKLRDFEVILRGGMAEAVDVAFLKFCYVDFDETTDAAAVFTAYRDAMRKLKADYPKLTIVHLSAPLTRMDAGKKAAIKRLIGWKIQGDAENAARNAYNQLMRAEYEGKEPFFDLALVEAAESSGAAMLHGTGTASYYALRPEYTYDGGHLNEAACLSVLILIQQIRNRRFISRLHQRREYRT